MELPYKLHLGASCISRPDFLRNLAHAREQRPPCSPETPRVWVPQLLASTESAPQPAPLPPPAPPPAPSSAPHSPRATQDLLLGLQPGLQPSLLDLDLDLDLDPPDLPAKGGGGPPLLARPVPRRAKQARHAKETSLNLNLNLGLAPQPLRPTHCWAEAHMTPVLATGCA